MVNQRIWMVRGEGGVLATAFERDGVVAIGWPDVGDLSSLQDREAIRSRLGEVQPELKASTLGVQAGMLHRFRNIMQLEDRVVSYDPDVREYLVGSVAGPYEYRVGYLDSYPNVRAVKWETRVSRDDLAVASRNTLGSTLTVFDPGAEVLQDFERVINSEPSAADAGDAEEEAEFDVLRRDVLSKASEFIQDRIQRLSPDELEELVAALLNAMGYRARVTPKGPDRGRDVTASPDGLGFQTPRIVAEVKHRKQVMGAGEVRSFLGGLREGDRGLFVSTGGFTREAHYEAERASVPVTLMNLELLAELVTEHYEDFDGDGRSLIPLMRVYWPI